MGFRIQIEIPRDTALSEDKSVNTFHCAKLAGVGVNWAAAAAAFTKFYNVAGPGRTSSIASHLASVNHSPARLKAYDLDEAEPRTPVFETDLALGPYGSDSLPEEVAIAISYRATPASGVNPRRTRGRLYIGPLDSDVDSTASGRVRVETTRLDDLLAPCPRLYTELVAAELGWSIYSRIDNVFTPIDEWLIDDAFDTQRRRGPDRTARKMIDSAGVISSLPVN